MKKIVSLAVLVATLASCVKSDPEAIPVRYLDVEGQFTIEGKPGDPFTLSFAGYRGDALVCLFGDTGEEVTLFTSEELPLEGSHPIYSTYTIGWFEGATEADKTSDGTPCRYTFTAVRGGQAEAIFKIIKR